MKQKKGRKKTMKLLELLWSASFVRCWCSCGGVRSLRFIFATFDGLILKCLLNLLVVTTLPFTFSCSSSIILMLENNFYLPSASLIKVKAESHRKIFWKYFPCLTATVIVNKIKFMLKVKKMLKHLLCWFMTKAFIKLMTLRLHVVLWNILIQKRDR